MFGRVVLCVVFSLSITAVAAKKPAGEIPDNRCDEGLVSGAFSEQEIQRYARACADYVGDHAEVPTQKALAAQLEVTTNRVKGFFAAEGTPDNIEELVEEAKQVFPAPFRKLRERVIREYSNYFRDHYRFPTKEELSERVGTPAEQFEIIHGIWDAVDLSEIVEERYPKTFQLVKTRIARAYARVAKATLRVPHPSEVAQQLGIEVETLQQLIGEGKLIESSDELNREANRLSPSSFDQVVDTNFFNEEKNARLVKAVKEAKFLILTTVIAGYELNDDALEGLLRMSKAKGNAPIIVYPANMKTAGLDERLLNNPNIHILTNTCELLPELRLDNVKMMAKKLWPLEGFDRMGDRGQSFIVGSPKMHVQTMATFDNEHAPHLRMTTGTISNPDYHGRKFISLRTDRIAAHDHMMGALVLEKTGGHSGVLNLGSVGRFHARHVEFIPEKRGFMDLDTFYGADGTMRVRPEALVLGDIHVGHLDEKLLDAVKRMIKELRPKRIVLHDLLNGHSISHYEKLDLVAQVAKAESGQNSIEREMERVILFVNSLMQLDSSMKVVVVPSNHDYWLHRWLKAGTYMTEPINTRYGLELANAYLSGKDPFEYALTGRGPKTLQVEKPERFIFLPIGSGYKVPEELPKGRQVELGQHGHYGANGSRGSIKGLQRASDAIVFGHTHTYARFNRAVNVGTLTEVVLGYNKSGASNWVQSAAIVGPNGEIQVMEYKEGEFYSDDKAPVPSADEFFPANYPRMVPNHDDNDDASEEGQIDQWSE